MKRRFLHFTFLLISLQTSLVFAQDHNNDDKSLLWKISGKNMSKPSYLFGTIHMICKNQYIWTESMQHSLDSANEVCMEMDMDDPSIVMEVAAAMMNTNGKRLEDYFTEEQYQIVSTYYKDSLGVNIAMFSTMKPIVLQTLLTTNIDVCDSVISYEMKLAEAAKQKNIEITGLETPAEQIQLLDKIPVDSIISELVNIASGKGDDLTEYEAMIEAYIKQDLPTLYEMILKSKEEGDNMDAFLDERNEKWIDRMTDRMEQKAIFFAVGAGHLWGPNGIIELLREDGYTVEPIH